MDKCKLCLDNEADFEGSHIVPHFLLKRIFNVEGKKGRDYELEFVIDAFITKSYYGRNVSRDKLETLFDEIHEGESEENKDPHVEDNIFCTSCENRLGAIEDLYSKSIKKHSVGVYDSGIKSELGLLFWASVLWRMSVNKKNGVSQTKGQDEILRRILNRCLKEKIGEIDLENIRQSRDLRNISYKLLRCPNFSDDNPTHLFMYPVIINPYTILIDEFVLFFSHNSNYNDYKVRDFYGIKDEVIDAPLNNKNENEKIMVISTDKIVGISNGIKNEAGLLRQKYINQFLDLLHKNLNGEPKMPEMLKNEVIEALNNSEAKEGVKFTMQHLRDITYSVLKKYGPQE